MKDYPAIHKEELEALWKELSTADKKAPRTHTLIGYCRERGATNYDADTYYCDNPKCETCRGFIEAFKKQVKFNRIRY